MKRLISAVFFVLISSQVFANGTVTEVRVDANGKGIITFSSPRTPTSGAVCNVGSGGLTTLAFDTNTVGGKNALAWALTAKATGAQTASYGTGTCIIYLGYGIEDFSGLYLR